MLRSLLLLLLLASGSASAQWVAAPEEGAPHAVRFNWSDYRAHSQNWAVTQSPEGLIYVANTWGVMEYDSGEWRLMPFGDEARTLARSLAVDASGHLFVGGVGEFGRLVPDSARTLRFRSLRHAVPAVARDFSDVWATHATPEGVVFQTPEYLFRWNGRRMQVWQAGTTFHLSFLVGGRVFVREEGVGLRELDGDRLVRVPGGEAFADRRVFALMEHPRGLLAAVRDEGLWVVAGGRADSLVSPASEMLKSVRPYAGLALRPNQTTTQYAIATLGGGVLICDERGQIVRIHREDIQVEAVDFILGMTTDQQGGLWLALHNGVVRFDLGARLTEFGAREGLAGTVYSVERHGGQLYASTSMGVFRLVPGRAGRPGDGPTYTHFEPLTTTDGSDPSQAWDLLSTGDDLFVATNGGAFRVVGDRLVPLTTQKTLRLGVVPGRSDVLLGEKDGIRVLRRTARGWAADTSHVEVGSEISSFATDGRNVWAGLIEGGVLRLAPDGGSFRVTAFGEAEGLAPGPATVVEWDGVRVIQLRGVSRPVGRPDRFVADPAHAELTDEFSLYSGADGRMWLYRDDVLRTLSGTPFSMRMGWAQVETVLEEPTGVVWVGTNDGLFRYDPRVAVPPRPFPAFVRRVTDAQRRTLYGGAAVTGKRVGGHQLVVPYRDNSLRFEFAAAAYSRPQSASYQFRLDGLDETGVWSPWAAERSTNYTQLFEGTYTFRVRARDAYGRIGEEATLTLRVLPPWYRTVWAYLAYALAFGLSLWGFVAWQTHTQRMRAETESARAARLHRLGIRLRETNARLRHEEKLKDDLLANASHELRTPLTSIMGYSELLLDEVPEEARDLAEGIHRGGTRMLGTVNGLLDMYKLQSGTLEVFPEALDAADVARQAVHALLPLAMARGLTLRVLPESLSVPATTDRGGLDRILTHLVGNAIKFTERGGVRVLIRLDQQGPAPQLVIEVIDSGIGIAPAQVDRLFEAFIQADETINRRFGGTGLGLAISRRFARALGGDIVVRSAPGEGSIFAVTLETGSLAGVALLSPAEMPRLEPLAASTVDVRWAFPAANVLVVDDGPENRELVRLVLQEHGLLIAEAENGAMAVDKALAQRFDVILMDMQMPVMDGFEATRKLRAAGLLVPIVALTANAMKGFEREVLAAGCSAYLTKPIDIDRLVETTAGVLGVQPLAASASRVPEATAGHDDEGLPVVSRYATHARFRSTVIKFSQRIGEQMAIMEQAWGERDGAELARFAHWLKGAGGTVGYDVFTEPATLLEQHAKSGDFEQALPVVEHLRALVRRMEIPDERSPEAVLR